MSCFTLFLTEYLWILNSLKTLPWDLGNYDGYRHFVIKVIKQLIGK